MNGFIAAGSTLAVLTYFPLWQQIRKKEVTQNVFTWILWAALDGIILATLVVQQGNTLLVTAYTIGSIITIYFIVKAKNDARWTRFESGIISLVLLSIAIWYYSDEKMATIAGTTGMLIAGIPQLIDAGRNPQNMPLLVYISYLVANFLSAAGGKNWSIEERFYPLAAGAYCLLLILLTCRKFSPKTRYS